MRRRATPVVCLLTGVTILGLTLPSPALAVLGIGDIVFDPTNYANAVQRFIQMQQQYQQLILTYQMIRNQYDQMIWMARHAPVDMETRYRGLFTPWGIASAGNTYGTTGAWTTAVNTGSGVGAGYDAASEPLRTYGGALGNIPSDQVDRVKTSYATVELTDGTNRLAMETIGRLRENAPGTERAIQNLENDSLSSDPEMNTEIAVLNKINAAHMLLVRGTQDANKLLVSLAEEQVIDAKRKRDAEARAINQHIRFVGEARELMRAQGQDASSAMLAWRMP